MLARTPRQKTLGDDGGCFAAALSAVRRFGGVLERPEASHAWRWFGLVPPPRTGGWHAADLLGGWTCCVEQGHYGHRARKATWLYACGMPGSALPELTWGPCRARTRCVWRTATTAGRSAWLPAAPGRDQAFKRLSARQRMLTPPAFAELLLGIAASSERPTPPGRRYPQHRTSVSGIECPESLVRCRVGAAACRASWRINQRSGVRDLHVRNLVSLHPSFTSSRLQKVRRLRMGIMLTCKRM